MLNKERKKTHSQKPKRQSSWATRTLMLLTSAAILNVGVGCELDSWGDPSSVGRFERTPAVLPILDRLSIIEPENEFDLPVTSVMPEDLLPSRNEYVLDIGDVVQVSVFELIQPGRDTIQTRTIDETGVIRMPVLKTINVAGKTASQLERDIVAQLNNMGVLRDATVSVQLLQSTKNTYSVVGEPQNGGTNVGTYGIPKPSFRLLEAISLARGVDGRVKTLKLYRQTGLTPEAAGEADPEAARRANETDQQRDAATENEDDLIRDLLGEAGTVDTAEPDADDIEDLFKTEDQQLEQVVDPGIDVGVGFEGGGQWVNVDGDWVRIEDPNTAIAAQAAIEQQLTELVTQRIIEIPWKRLIDGDMRYNLIIRPGDVIRIPSTRAGFVYVTGEIARPGAYTVPGENELTLTQLIASAGGLGPLAIPERVDIRRRIGDDQEAIARINLREIVEGNAPNFFLKPNDEIVIGTNFWAQPLATIRNGFRMTYGFGFIIDRNFGTDVFPP